MDITTILTVISIAFLGSFGHCIGMCGGIVLAYSAAKIDKDSPRLAQATSHFSYSIGRVFSYAILGAFFGYIGKVSTFSMTANASLMIFAGFIMIITAFALSGKIKIPATFQTSISNSNIYKNTFSAVLKSKSKFSFFLLGMLNGFLPCGFVYFFAITAVSTASPFYGAIIMIIFGLSTVPVMFGLGFLASLSVSLSSRKIMMNIASITILAFGIFTIYKGYSRITGNMMPHKMMHNKMMMNNTGDNKMNENMMSNTDKHDMNSH